MSGSTETSGGGIGFGGLLAILFIGLKLAGYIDWSWWWVLGPLWIPLAMIAALFVFFLIFFFVVDTIKL